MAFNSSAPSISLEEEQRERESLTEDEKLALQRDLYGSDDQHLIQFESTPESLASYEAALHQSLDEIPMEQKRDYVEALERSSQLVRRETPYQAFLRCEEYNASAAARRIVAYWKMKRQLFGERAFLPLAEALTKEDVDMLRSGFIQGLPYDEMKRKLILWKGSQIEGLTLFRNNYLRAMFFVVHTIVMTDNLAQLNGVVILCNMKVFDVSKNFDRPFFRIMIEMLRFCLPCRLVARHICFATAGKNMWDIIGPSIKYLYGKGLRLRTIVHGGSNSELVTSLHPFHIPRESLPECLGGEVHDEPYQAWLNDQFKGISTSTEPPLVEGSLAVSVMQTLRLEDERIERASLSDEERTILAMDLYGNGCQPTLETPEMLAKAMQEVHKILESALASRKLVCETALSPVSEAVGKEMDWLAFLRAEKYVCQATAARIAGCWDLRCKLLGDRAIRPLRDSMAAEEIMLMKQGLVQALPNDSRGKKVVLWKWSDMQNYIGPRSSHHLLRAIFYSMLTLVRNDESAQHHGIVLLFDFKSYDISRGLDRLFTKTALDMVGCCLPVRVVAQHCFFGPVGQNLWDVFIGPCMNYLASKHLRLRTIVHCGTNAELVASVQPYHIPVESMPVGLGGTVADRVYLEYLDQHLRSVGLIE